MTSARRCSATRIDGRPCQAWARRNSDPPLCYAHYILASRVEPDRDGGSQPADSIYGRVFSEEEVAHLFSLAVSDNLNGEVAAVRMAVRRVVLKLQQELEPADVARLTGLVFRGADTIARLLKTRHSLSEPEANEIVAAFGEALDNLADEWGVDL